MRRRNPLGGGLAIAGGCVFVFFGLISLESHFRGFDWSGGVDLFAIGPAFGPGLVITVLGLFLIRAGRSVWIGRR